LKFPAIAEKAAKNLGGILLAELGVKRWSSVLAALAARRPPAPW